MALLDFINPIASIIDKALSFIPDPQQREQAKLAAMKMNYDAELDAMKTSMSAILAEESSDDKWTSRARPSFMYVIYLLILASIPMAVVYAFKADLAHSLIDGFHLWLAAIPDSYLQLFGVGYLGYAGGRSWEKVTSIKNQ